MSWRIAVSHRSHYRYAGPVGKSYNEARITPLTTTTQLVLESAVAVTPATRPYRYIDYWGSIVHAFDVHEAHTDLVVTGASTVETSVLVAAAAPVGWDVLADAQRLDDFAEVLAPTRAVPVDDRLVAVAAELRAAAATPDDAARAAAGWVHDQLRYLPGSTGVHTSAVEAWDGGAGVCQDFAHLTLAVLRAAGIPARYCSGYLHPNADAGVGQRLLGESHAWVEWWTGDWRGFDPTSGWPVGERHVLVARGRDYTDVAPFKGVIDGGPTAGLSVEVALTRVG
ncbi:MAG TPA: transglutaminase family protein [Acidimicrobiales bacterium]|nr:transglutaminase family protein [Acidimicrobiales bacterium]